eukprot:13688695-Heterocapsa_arctica.AAC.1
MAGPVGAACPPWYWTGLFPATATGGTVGPGWGVLCASWEEHGWPAASRMSLSAQGRPTTACS